MKTINPLLLLGSYLGVLAGLLLYFLNLHPFWWVAPLFGLKINSILILDVIGGAILGYTLHILTRIFNYHIEKISNKNVPGK